MASVLGAAAVGHPESLSSTHLSLSALSPALPVNQLGFEGNGGSEGLRDLPNAPPCHAPAGNQREWGLHPFFWILTSSFCLLRQGASSKCRRIQTA